MIISASSDLQQLNPFPFPAALGVPLVLIQHWVSLRPQVRSYTALPKVFPFCNLHVVIVNIIIVLILVIILSSSSIVCLPSSIILWSLFSPHHHPPPPPWLCFLHSDLRIPRLEMWRRAWEKSKSLYSHYHSGIVDPPRLHSSLPPALPLTALDPFIF